MGDQAKPLTEKEWKEVQTLTENWLPGSSNDIFSLTRAYATIAALRQVIDNQGLKCLPTCDSIAHDERCPLVFPAEVIATLEKEISGFWTSIQEMLDKETLEKYGLQKDNGTEAGRNIAQVTARLCDALNEAKREIERLTDVNFKAVVLDKFADHCQRETELVKQLSDASKEIVRLKKEVDELESREITYLYDLVQAEDAINFLHEEDYDGLQYQTWIKEHERECSACKKSRARRGES